MRITVVSARSEVGIGGSMNRRDATKARAPAMRTAVARVVFAVPITTAVALGLWLRNRTQDIDSTEQDRAEVVAAAQRFTVTWNSIDPKQAKAYVAQVRELVTDTFLDKAFGGKVGEAARLIRQGGITSDAKVLVNGDGIPLVGVSTLDPNSAVVLVVADSNRQVNGQTALRHWRWQLGLVKEGDEWLVDDLSTV